MNKPIVGVIISESQLKKLVRQKPHVMLVELKKANEQVKTILYFFSIKDVNFKKKIIMGTYFNRKKALWEKKEFPFPEIIYRRASSSKLNLDKVHQLQKELTRMKTKPLNFQISFNKWDVYEKLKNNDELQPHLPTTIIYRTPADLKKMFLVADKIYLKACRGGQGKQVIRIVKLPQGGYEYSYFTDQLHVYKVKTFQRLMQRVLTFFGSRKFIVQKAIDLITIEHSIVDLRAEVQRNGQGKITVVGIPVRVGCSNSPITTHASSYPFDYFFTEIMKYEKEEIELLKNKLHSFLTIIYENIESIYGPAGEIGIDIGMDAEGKLWYIECNSLSKKVSLFNAYDQKTISTSFVNLLEYAKHLRRQKG